MGIFLQGLLTGLAYVAPIGVQNIFVIHASISQKTGKALFVVFITALMDISLALLAFFGMGALVSGNPWLQKVLFLVGGLVVIKIGFGLLQEDGAIIDDETADLKYGAALLSAFSVTWLNPQAIIDGALLLGGARELFSGNQVSLFIVGVNTASILWFFTIFLVARFLRPLINQKTLRGINVLSGIFIMILGARLLGRFFATL